MRWLAVGTGQRVLRLTRNVVDMGMFEMKARCRELLLERDREASLVLLLAHAPSLASAKSNSLSSRAEPPNSTYYGHWVV